MDAHGYECAFSHLHTTLKKSQQAHNRASATMSKAPTISDNVIHSIGTERMLFLTATIVSTTHATTNTASPCPKSPHLPPSCCVSATILRGNATLRWWCSGEISCCGESAAALVRGGAHIDWAVPRAGNGQSCRHCANADQPPQTRSADRPLLLAADAHRDMLPAAAAAASRAMPHSHRLKSCMNVSCLTVSAAKSSCGGCRRISCLLAQAAAAAEAAPYHPAMWPGHAPPRRPPAATPEPSTLQPA